MSDEARRWYGVQFHPEVTHTKSGQQMLERFAVEICGCERLWTAANIIEDQIARETDFATLFAEELKAATPRASTDQKTTLQELLQSTGETAPRYEILKTEGPPHSRTFFVRVEWAGGKAEGAGSRG